MTTPTVTIYTPAYKSASTLVRCVQSIRSQTVPVQSIVTVQDGDSQATNAALDLGLTNYIYRKQPDGNRGLAACCNTALENCTTDFLAKVDSDVCLAPNWLETCLATFEAQPDVAGVGGRLVESAINTAADQWRVKFMKQHWGPNIQVNPPGLFGADCIFRTEALRKVGGWDARYKTNFEDMDLCQRLIKAGYPLVYEPAALCRHLPRKESLFETLLRFWRWYMPPWEDEGAYKSLDGITKLSQHWFKLCTRQIQESYQEGDFHLIQPSYLLYYVLCACDRAKLEGWTVKSMDCLPAAATNPREAAAPWVSFLTPELLYILEATDERSGVR